ncbi:unnamed protein product, partial [Ilex paraguariensis]
MGEVPWAPPGEARKIPLGVALLGEAPSGKAPWALSIEQGDRSMSRLAHLGVKYRGTSSGVVHEVTQLGVECEVAQPGAKAPWSQGVGGPVDCEEGVLLGDGR